MLTLKSLTEEEQEKMLFLSSEARFIFYKTLAQKVSMPEIRIVCAISMDGCHFSLLKLWDEILVI